MNLEKWNALSPDHQQILSAAAMEGQKANLERIGRDNANAVEQMKKAGLNVTYPDRSAFAARIGPVYEQFAKSIDPSLLQQIQDANK